MNQQGEVYDSTYDSFDVLAAAMHDVKTPLSLVRNLASEFEFVEDEQVRANMIREISRNADHLLQIVETVSRAHHVQQMEFELNLEPVDLAAVINAAAYETHVLAEQFSAPLQLRISRRLPTVMAHRKSLESIVGSLLDTVIRSSRGSKPIRLHAKRIGEEVALSVSDASVGVRSREWSRIINAPGTAVQPSVALGARSGISLYAIHRLARAMHGDFVAQPQNSTANGSVFVLRLPQVTQLQLL